MYSIKNNPKRYYKIMNNYHEAQLLFAAIRLNIFSYLDTYQTSESIAQITNCDKRQIELLLLSLASCELVNKHGEFYINTPETKEFLSRNSKVFLGDAIMFREKMTSLDQLEQRVKTSTPVSEADYDFSELAQVTIPEIYAGRVQSFINEMMKIYPDYNSALNILDLGGGTGILDIEFVKQYPNSKATILETPEVAVVTKNIVDKHNAQKNIDVVSGNFNSDPFGGPYDFIIASGILNFVEGNLSSFMKKISDALKDGGYLLIIGQYEVNEDNIPSNLLSWLSGFLNGIPLPPNNQEVVETLQKYGLTISNKIKDSMFEGHLYKKGNTDSSVSSSDVIHSFIELTEKISNSKTNILNFGSEDMTFYRGEIHMIKMIGDYPGIHSAELARKFGITRPVVHKTLQKLSDRDLIIKKDNPDDKKRFLLYLTDKGKTAYSFHKKYHEEYDMSLLDFIKDMPDNKLDAINSFLEHAISLIENHS